MPTFRGAIFDVDGVLVDSPHQKAWRESLRELMESDWAGIRDRTTWSPEAFTPQVYQEYMSGKPRMNGARAALDYFHVPDPEQRAAEYGQRKQEMVVRLIKAGDFTAYPDALRFAIAVKDAWPADRGRVIVEERHAAAEQDPARHVREGTRDLLPLHPARPDAAGVLRRRPVGARLRARQAGPRDLRGLRAGTRRQAG